VSSALSPNVVTGVIFEAVKATLGECRRRWSAGGNRGKVYDLKRPGVREEMWLDMARATGNECANLFLR
jgi:hypothetical protein